MITRTQRISIVLGMSLCLIQPAFADSKFSCDKNTLKGTYMFSASGKIAVGHGNFVPTAYVGFVAFDGKGNMVVKRTIRNLNTGVFETADTSGTYVIESDCTGVATYPSFAKFKYYVAPDGSNIVFVKTDNYVGNGFVPSPDSISSTSMRVSKH